jgi:Serine carboxypeptidase S28
MPAHYKHHSLSPSQHPSSPFRRSPSHSITLTTPRSVTFQQRFWVNTRHYKPRHGSPVIVFDGSETNGEDRLPFLDTGVGDILARATGGIAVVLEHRYYGTCIPGLSLDVFMR